MLLQLCVYCCYIKVTKTIACTTFSPETKTEECIGRNDNWSIFVGGEKCIVYLVIVCHGFFFLSLLQMNRIVWKEHCIDWDNARWWEKWDQEKLWWWWAHAERDSFYTGTEHLFSVALPQIHNRMIDLLLFLPGQRTSPIIGPWGAHAINFWITTHTVHNRSIELLQFQVNNQRYCIPKCQIKTLGLNRVFNSNIIV